jgi:hypothetical protein
MSRFAFYFLAAFGFSVGGLYQVAAAADKDEDGFQALFNGKDFTGWKTFLPKNEDPDKTWSIKDGEIVCTGHPNGYFYTEKPYKNYVIRYEWN